MTMFVDPYVINFGKSKIRHTSQQIFDGCCATYLKLTRVTRLHAARQCRSTSK